MKVRRDNYREVNLAFAVAGGMKPCTACWDLPPRELGRLDAERGVSATTAFQRARRMGDGADEYLAAYRSEDRRLKAIEDAGNAFCAALNGASSPRPGAA